MNIIQPYVRAFCSGLPAVILSLMLLACSSSENPAQKQAFETARKMEQTYTFETAEKIIAAYRKVIAIEPGSDLAEKAEARLEAVETRYEADEHHKSVFHEHGID